MPYSLEFCASSISRNSQSNTPYNSGLFKDISSCKNDQTELSISKDDNLTDFDLELILDNLIKNTSRSTRTNHKKQNANKDFQQNITQALPEIHLDQIKELRQQSNMLVLHTVIEENEELNLKQELSKVGDWNFNIFRLEKLTKHQSLVKLGYYVLKKKGYIEAYSINTLKLQQFLQKINGTYIRENIYHNATHGADVTNSVLFLIETAIANKADFTPIEAFSLITAAMVHDLGHKGVNNSFLVQTQDFLALIYNDQSVLENMHISKTFDILDQYNITENMTKEEFKVFRKLIIKMVLDTDLQRHYDIMKAYEKNIEPTQDFSDEFKRIATLSMCLKCADVGHGAKQNDLHQIWSRRITLEFYNQGKLEEERGLPVSQLCSRQTDITKSQIGFLKFLVQPMYIALYETVDNNELNAICIQEIQKNIDFWDFVALKRERGEIIFDVDAEEVI